MTTDIDSFYVTLLSNGSLDFHPNNKPSHFTNALECARALNGSWEVGLKQIQFPGNVPFKTVAFEFVAWFGRLPHRRKRLSSNPELPYENSYLVNLPNTNFHQIDDYDWNYIVCPPGTWCSAYEYGTYLAKLILEKMKVHHPDKFQDVTYYRDKVNYQSDFILHTDDTSNRASLAITTAMPEYMRYLGFQEANYINYFKLLEQDKSSYPKSVNGGTQMYLFDRPVYGKQLVQSDIVGFPGEETFFVHTDIVENQIVGDKHAGLLQVVPAPAANSSERQFIEFSEPVYLRVKPLDALTSISIRITDLNGKNIEMKKENAFTCAQLHFRKRN